MGAVAQDNSTLSTAARMQTPVPALPRSHVHWAACALMQMENMQLGNEVCAPASDARRDDVLLVQIQHEGVGCRRAGLLVRRLCRLHCRVARRLLSLRYHITMKVVGRRRAGLLVWRLRCHHCRAPWRTPSSEHVFRIRYSEPLLHPAANADVQRFCRVSTARGAGAAPWLCYSSAQSGTAKPFD